MKKLLLSIFIFTLSFFTFTQQMVSTVAGSGSEGNTNGIGTEASFFKPGGICSDASGNIYVADSYNHLIRKITPNGVVSTFAGSGSGSNANGTGILASFNFPQGLCIDASGNIYVADSFNNLIRKITPNGVVSTFAGGGSGNNTNGTGTVASFGGPKGICLDASGNIYVADTENNLIRKITPNGTVSTFAGNGTFGNTDGTGTIASFNRPYGLCSDASGNIYVADSQNRLIRKITPNGIVSTFAGNGSFGHMDGMGTTASFSAPNGLCSDAYGNVYVEDFNLIRIINSSGYVSTYAGNVDSGNLNGTGTNARFNFPLGICSDGSGKIYVADTGNNLIRKITSTAGISSTFQNYLQVYPNPSTGVFSIELPLTSQLEVYNACGQVIYSENATEGVHIINIKNNANGVYFLKVISLDNQQITKLIKKD